MDRYCSYCGTKIRKDGTFCEGCGRKIISEEMQIKQMEEKLKEEIKKDKEIKIVDTSLNLRNIIIDLGFSLIIAIGLVAISVIVGGIIIGSIDRSGIFNMEIGWPFGWLQMTNNGINISNWLNLIFDFIIYTLICFALFLCYDILYKHRKK